MRGTGGDYDVYARIRSLTDDAAWHAFVRQARTGPAGRDVAMVLAGTVTLPATPTGVELRLPPEWEK